MDVILIGIFSGLATLLLLLYLRYKYNLFVPSKQATVTHTPPNTLLNFRETSFLSALDGSVKLGHKVFYRVPLQNITNDNTSETGLFKNMYVDFIVCKEDGSLHCAIIFDDCLHIWEYIKSREAVYSDIFKIAGLRLEFFKHQKHYDLNDIKEKLYSSSLSTEDEDLEKIVNNAFKK